MLIHFIDYVAQNWLKLLGITFVLALMLEMVISAVCDPFRR